MSDPWHMFQQNYLSLLQKTYPENQLLSEENYIEISGQVNNPGIFPFSKNITLSDFRVLVGDLVVLSITISGSLVAKSGSDLSYL